MGRVLKLPLAITGALALLLGLAAPLSAATAAGALSRQFRLAEAMVPSTGTTDAQHPMPMNDRMLKRFPQAVRVGDLLGLPVLDQNASTLGYVRQVVRMPQASSS